MKRLFRPFAIMLVLALAGSCSKVAFRSQPNNDGGTGGKSCDGPECGPGGKDETYYWHEGAYNVCSKPCGGGSQTALVECRRSSDDVVVSDSFCTGAKPAASRSCNLQVCTGQFGWSWSDFGDCSKSCGGGVKTRTVVCKDTRGTTVNDSNCPPPKPDESVACNTQDCGSATYAWQVTAGTCSKPCGGGVAYDAITCRRNDGVTVADSFCDAATKPAASRTCNTQDCPPGGYTYSWEPQPWSACSKDCGDGLQSRAVACKRSDGVYVDVVNCDANTKPPTSQSCHLKDCPSGGTPVTQTETVPPAQNLLDVILVVDDSSSMANDQAKLASRLIQFVNDLDALNIDYQICLTTTDVGYYKGSPIRWSNNQFILNKNTANKNSIFQTTVNGLGAQWSSDEQPIKSTYFMIRDFGPGSASNSGCFRDRSTLTVIAISDEDERSVGGNASLSQAQYKPLTSENMPDNLISSIHSKFDSTGFVKPFIWNSIIVRPGDTACEQRQDSEGSPSFPGVLLAQLASRTNGQIASICDADYAQNMTLIRNRVVNNMPGLTLQCVPIDNPVVTYSPPFTTTVTRTGAELKFNPALPENTQVTIKYTCP